MKSHTASVLAFVLVATVACGSGTPGTDAGSPAPPGQASSGTADACAMLTAATISAAVGNPVKAGQPNAGPEVCKWDTDDQDQVSVLLTVRLAGSIRAPILCDDVQKGNSGTPVPGVGDASGWKYSKMADLFSSGDLEVCSGGHFVALSLNGRLDEPAMKEAAVALAREVLGRL